MILRGLKEVDALDSRNSSQQLSQQVFSFQMSFLFIQLIDDDRLDHPTSSAQMTNIIEPPSKYVCVVVVVSFSV